MGIEDKCRVEVEELHQFFEQWFRGHGDAGLGRVAAALDEEFSVLFPSGNRQGKQGLLDALEKGLGANRDLGDKFTVHIEGFEVIYASRTAAVVRYEEWQDAGGRVSARASTAVFRADKDAPNGVTWVHLQETWLPGRSDAWEAP